MIFQYILEYKKLVYNMTNKRIVTMLKTHLIADYQKALDAFLTHFFFTLWL